MAYGHSFIFTLLFVQNGIELEFLTLKFITIALSLHSVYHKHLVKKSNS
jgi:hypothetical protein